MEKTSNSTLNSKTVSSNSTPDMCFWMCFYLLSLISFDSEELHFFFLVIYASYILHCVSNAQEDPPYCHIFGTSLHSAPQAQEVPAQDHFPQWETGTQPELKLQQNSNIFNAIPVLYT